MRSFVVVLAIAALAAAEESAAQKAFSDLEMGEPLAGKTVILFPLRAKAAPADPGVLANTRTKKLTFAEPEKPKHKYDVLVTNNAEEPVLLVGGTVLVGGKIDRLVRRDHLIGPGQSVTIRTLPAAASSDMRKEAIPFDVDPALAPLYVRRRADTGGTPSLVPNFVARWLEFRDKGDERRSLAAIAESDVLQEFALQDQKSAGMVPEVLKDDRLVGAVTAVRGRIQSVIIYATNDFALAHLFPLVKGAAWANAAIELHAKKLGVPVPGSENPAETLKTLNEDATKLIERLRKASYKMEKVGDGEIGEFWRIQTSGARGHAVVHDGRLVHLVVYPYDPFEAKLYGSKIRLPGEEGESVEDEPDDGDDDSTEGPGAVELNRRNVPGRRLTESERRLLDRMNAGRGGGARGGGRR